uniref:Uncharacterized protein n=1 Tax=Acrobeloides nanus TaxID=290746 RepID=A0A914DS90_9BILA
MKKNNYGVLIFTCFLFAAIVCAVADSFTSIASNPVISSSSSPVASDEDLFAKSDKELTGKLGILKDDVFINYDSSRFEEANLKIFLHKPNLSVPIGRMPGRNAVHPKSIKMRMKLANSFDIDNCNDGVVGATVSFYMKNNTQCGFSYAWNLNADKFLISINYFGALLYRDVILNGVRDVAVELRNDGGISQVYVNDQMVIDKDGCFPNYPDLKDYTASHVILLPFVIRIDTGAPNCGMFMEMKNGYVVLKNLKIPDDVDTSSPMTAMVTQLDATTPSRPSPGSTIAESMQTPTPDSSDFPSSISTAKGEDKPDYKLLLIIMGVLLIIIVLLLIANLFVYQRNRHRTTEAKVG